MHQAKRQEFYCISCGQELGRARVLDEKELNFTCSKCHLTYLAHVPDRSGNNDVEIEILSGKGDFEAVLNQPVGQDGLTPMFCIFTHRNGDIGHLWKKDKLFSADEPITIYYCTNASCKKTFSITGH